jgi:hypothetical protein
MNNLKSSAIVLILSCLTNNLFNCEGAVAKPRILDDSYYAAHPSGHGFTVKNNIYSLPTMDDPDSLWRPTTKMKQVSPGVIFVDNTYFCSAKKLFKIKNNQSKILFCTKKGWGKLEKK